MSNFLCGMMLIVILGKYCVLNFVFSKENLEYCAPLMRTGRMFALAFSATMPAPSYTFIKAPVTLMRCSGKIMTLLLRLIKSINERKDSGLFKSKGYKSTISEKNRANQRFSHSGLMTNVIFSGMNAAISRPSSKDVWLATIKTRLPDSWKLGSPLTVTRNSVSKIVCAMERTKAAGRTEQLYTDTTKLAKANNRKMAEMPKSK